MHLPLLLLPRRRCDNDMFAFGVSMLQLAHVL